jgi:hypothetical protein
MASMGASGLPKYLSRHRRRTCFGTYESIGRFGSIDAFARPVPVVTVRARKAEAEAWFEGGEAGGASLCALGSQPVAEGRY